MQENDRMNETLQNKFKLKLDYSMIYDYILNKFIMNTL